VKTHSGLWHVSVLKSFLWLNHIPLHGYTRFGSFSISWWTFAVPPSFVLWIILLWTFVNKFLCGHMFSFLLGLYLGMELLGHVVTLSLWIKIWETSIVIFKVTAVFHIPSSSVVTISPHTCQHLMFSVLFMVAILVVVKWYHCGSDLHFPNE
jgi:hypothetical protein